MRGHMAIEQSSSLMEVFAAAVLSDAQQLPDISPDLKCEFSLLVFVHFSSY